MPDLRGLTIVVPEVSPERFRSALGMAAAQAALGGRVRLFLDGSAVALLKPPIITASDERHRVAGLPTLAQLVGEAFALDVEIVACQSGLALAGVSAADLDQRLAFAGMVSILQTLGEDRLVLA